MRRLTLTTLALTSCFAAFGCANKDETKEGAPVAREHVSTGPATGSVSVTVTFPSDAVKSVTDSVHVYVLNETFVAKDGATANCGDLVGSGLDPYSVDLGRAADAVTKRTEANPNPFDAAISVTKVETGQAFIYVEAVGYGGEVEYAGCVPKDVTGATSVAITLSRAGVYNCDDPLTKEGAPCDDNKLCTVGEKCKAGKCTDSIPRNCDSLTDACNAGTCDEARGCYPNPLINGTPCDDNNYCTVNDACSAGKCTGATRDCLAEEPCAATVECVSGGGGSGYCNALTYKAYQTPCNDGDPCTSGEYCGSFGYCGYGTICAGTNDPYQYCNGTCIYGTTTAQNVCSYSGITGGFCNDGDACTTGEVCSSTGACGGGTAVSCAGNAGSCYSTTCDKTSGCSAYAAMGTTCTNIYSQCSLYSSSLTGVPHCNSTGSCIYYQAGSVGSYGCY